MASEMRPRRDGEPGPYCFACEAERPGQASTKTTDAERKALEMTSVPALFWQLTRSQIGSSHTQSGRLCYWAQGGLQ